MQLAYGVLEGQHDPAMSIEDARHLAAQAIQAPTERDTGSGNGLALATITGDGVDIETYDDVDEVL
jgi:proteasome beta subunit